MKSAINHNLTTALVGLAICASTSCSNQLRLTYKDNTLPGNIDAYTAKDIFIALPSHYFEMPISQRAERLNSKNTIIDDTQKEIVMFGDGAQLSIRMQIMSWSEPNYTVKVNQYQENETITTLLRRIPGGWTQISTTSSSAIADPSLPH